MISKKLISKNINSKKIECFFFQTINNPMVLTVRKVQWAPGIMSPIPSKLKETIIKSKQDQEETNNIILIKTTRPTCNF
jgi:predicted metal-dependent enzyme (double-stranded beta helix superfamily)